MTADEETALLCEQDQCARGAAFHALHEGGTYRDVNILMAEKSQP